MGALIGGIVSGIAANIGSDWIQNRFNKPSSPFDEFIAAFLELLPQFIALILIIASILMYVGVFKNYKLKIGVLLYPIGIAILYLIALNVASLFSFWIVIAIALVLFFTVVYLKLAYSIYKGKYQFKDATKVLDMASEILEKDVKREDKKQEKE